MAKNRYNNIIAVIVMLLAVPSAAHANAGTPLMWFGFLRLALGNAVIGVIEGFLLASLFKINRSKAVGLMMS